jgi:hypothetical protein
MPGCRPIVIQHRQSRRVPTAACSAAYWCFMRGIAFFATIFLCCASALPAQISIEGRVTNSATKDPVPYAYVSLACVKPATKYAGRCRNEETKTAEDGTFKFERLSSFVYLVRAEGAPGLVSTRASEIEIENDFRHRPLSVSLKLEPESSLSGRVTDLENHPHPDVEVVAWRQFATGSVTQIKPVAHAVSDETGAYSFPHLVPGNYYVGTALVTTKQVSKLRTRPLEQYQLYAPSALSLEEAIPTHVDMGQSYAGVDLKIRPIMTHLIQGRAQTETTGQAVCDKLELHLDPRDHQGITAPGREIKLDEDGRFQANVLPGNYILRLIGTTAVQNPKTPKAPPDTMLHLPAKQDLEVSGKDILNINLLIPPPFLINGHVILEGAQQNNMDLGEVTLRPIDAEAVSGYRTTSVQPDGTFTITNCDAANYAVRYKPPVGIYISAITFNGQDAMTHLMDLSNSSGGDLKILLKPGASSVVAIVPDSDTPADIVLIPDNWTANELVPVIHMTSKDGRYSAIGIAPGHYSAVAVPAVERSLWDNAAFVHEMQSRGTPFDLAENDQKRVSAIRLTEEDLHQIELQLGLYY